MKRKLLLLTAIAILAFLCCGCGILNDFPADEQQLDSSAVIQLEQRVADLEQAVTKLEDKLSSINGSVQTQNPDDNESPPAVSGISFPYAFNTKDIYGNTVTAAALGNKEVFFVHLWATWCPPCIDEMPDFPELIETYGDRVGFIALLTDYSDNRSGAVNIVETAGIPDSFIMINAYESGLSELLEMLDSGYVPTTILISASGAGEQIVGAKGKAYAGYLDEALGN